MNTSPARPRFPTTAPSGFDFRLVDTPGLGEIEGLDRHVTAAKAAQDADLVLLVVDGPLRQSEFALLEQLGQMDKRVLICLNKEDWYAEAEREKRAKIIHASGEFEASKTLGEAAQEISKNPAALQLRYLQTLSDISTENTTTIVFPLPLDMLKVFDKKN